MQRFFVHYSEADAPSYRRLLEERLRFRLGLDETRGLVALSSGTNAIRAALRIFALRSSRREAIVPAITARSTLDAVLMAGFRPVLADVRPDNWCIDLTSAAALVSRETALIVSVDWLGTLADYAELADFRQAHGVGWVSDSAQAFGATVQGRPAVNGPDALIYSTGWPKVYSTYSHGGLLIAGRDELIELERDALGLFRHELMPELNAAHGLAMLPRIDDLVERRRAVLQAYYRAFGGVKQIRLQRIDEPERTNGYQATIVLDGGPLSRDALHRHLAEAGIGSDPRRSICVVDFPQLAGTFSSPAPLPEAEFIGRHSLTLPIGRHVDLEDVARVAQAVVDAVGRRRSQAGTPPVPSQQSGTVRPGAAWSSLPGMATVEWINADSAGPFDGAGIAICYPASWLTDPGFSNRDLTDALARRRSLAVGDHVRGGVGVARVEEEAVLLADVRSDDPAGRDLALFRSGGSPAMTILKLSANGDLHIDKRCTWEGVDGNGVPWMRRQREFYASPHSEALRAHSVVPFESGTSEEGEWCRLPYLPSRTLGDLVLAEADPEPAFRALVRLLETLAEDVWTQNSQPSEPDYLKKIHLDRVRRRTKLLVEASAEAQDLMAAESITINGRRCDNLDSTLDRIERHLSKVDLEPSRLGLIHGDLNLNNVLLLNGSVGALGPSAFRLIDPRGDPCGDFAYDLSKALMSLDGFLAIREGMVEASADPDGAGRREWRLKSSHPGVGRGFRLAQRLRAYLASERFLRMVPTREGAGTAEADRLRLRIELGTAANLVADAPCALARDKPGEVIPLLLLGMLRFQSLLEQMLQLEEARSEPARSRPAPGFAEIIPGEYPIAFHGSGSSAPDVYEFSIGCNSVAGLRASIRRLSGSVLPPRLPVYLSHECYRELQFPCALLHVEPIPTGQLNAFASAVVRSRQFYFNHGLEAAAVQSLRTASVISTGLASRSARLAQGGDKLLMPTVGGLSPLRLLDLAISQLPFPTGGRWVLNNDTFFLASQPVRFTGLHPAVLGGRRDPRYARYRGDVLHWSRNPAFDLVDAVSPGDHAESADEGTSYNLGAYFMPAALDEQFAAGAFLSTPLPLSIIEDLVGVREGDFARWQATPGGIPNFAKSTALWETLAALTGRLGIIEYAHAGDSVAHLHFGSDLEYLRCLELLRSEPRLRAAVEAGTRLAKGRGG